ncbi:MAG: HAMP domain-containing histidine kinase, partial [Ruminococcus sp.]|nr:HAMP domain-containing histidine kinase [Ruminococcus sp.]
NLNTSKPLYIGNAKYNLIMDTDKYSYAFYNCIKDGMRHTREGKIDYEHFKSSMSDEQYKTISNYLYSKLGYYELLCTSFYYIHPGKIIPKTVKIVKTDSTNPWNGTDTPIEEFELNPSGVENAEYLKNAHDTRDVIPGDFVVGTHRSSGLMEDPYIPPSDSEFETYNGLVEKTGNFTYTYENKSVMTVQSISEIYENSFDEGNLPSDSAVSYNEIISIHYKRRFNVLESIKSTLIGGLIGCTLFFLIIGAILVISLRKIIKTQIVEEEKRREVTNALAHDIKTPLFIISGYAQNLKENLNAQKREHYYDRIIERTNEVNSLVHKMLDFSRLGTFEHNLNLENIDIEELTAGVLRDYYNIPQSKNITVRADEKCIIKADRELLRRAVSYLVDNAVKYSLDDTDISIVLGENKFSISNRCDNVTHDDIKNLTEEYFRVEKNRNSKGNGLGLSIVKSICDVHDFALDIVLNNDTITFTISFRK